MNHDRFERSVDEGEKVEGRPYRLDIKEKPSDDFLRIGHFHDYHQALDCLVKCVILLSPKPRLFKLWYNDNVVLIGDVKMSRDKFGKVQVEIG